jgi:membrane protease YdiL (CAAX protease family)
MVVSEVVRLRLADPLAWIACDYAGRIVALAVLVAVPAARQVAFAREPMRRSWWEVALWVIALVAFDRIVDHAVSDLVNAMVPGTRIGNYPSPRGWLFALDISAGLALVAYSEEVIFRRCARSVLAALVGDRWAMVVVTAALFAAYHWWSGVGHIAATMLFGIAAMLCYRRLGTLSPVVLAHYLCDAANFS